jgi:hypothetical protein
MKLHLPKIGKAIARKLGNTCASSYGSSARSLTMAAHFLPAITHLAAVHYFRGYL